MRDLKIFGIKNTCTGCGACVATCPTKCIEMHYDEEGFWFPQIAHQDDCIACRKCERVCHVINSVDVGDKPVWWEKSIVGMFYVRDEELRNNSTSGGAMTMIANYVLGKGGVVYSTLYNGDAKRLEFSSSDQFDLSFFRKSRYFESFSSEIFEQVKNSLKGNRFTLFIGTPCQVKALKYYLGGLKNDEHLLTVNFVCHGVPSNEIFHDYINAKYHLQSIRNVDSRYQDKKHGWHSTYMKIDLSNKSPRIIPYATDAFCKSFLRNEYLRRSCYGCNHLFSDFADITIGDFWGIKYFNPEIDDNKGISLVILHSAKAEIIRDYAENTGYWLDIPYDCLGYIIDEYKSKDINSRFKGDKKYFLKHLLKDYNKEIWKNKVKLIIKQLLGK